MKIEEYRGIRGLVYAKVISDTTDGISYGTVKAIAGTSQLTKSTATSNEAHYYDNVPAVVITGVGADAVTADVSAIPLETIADLTGQYYDSTTGLFVEKDGNAPYVAIGYVTTKTDGTDVYVWRNKCKATLGDTTHQTKDAGTTANGQQITFTGVATTYQFSTVNAGAKAVYIETDNNPSGITEQAFFTSVQTPDTIGGTVDVVGVGVAPAAATIAVGATIQAIATVIPTNATNRSVTWSVTSGDSYASVSANGLITGLAAGVATVTATTADGSYTDSITVTVETEA